MAVKKRSATTARKTAARKTAARTTARRPRLPSRTAGTVRITFRCVNGTCMAQPQLGHMSKGDTVVMKALGTDVEIRFTASSPFATRRINIAAGDEHSEVVTKDEGIFPYVLKCSKCLLILSVPPEMIVP